MSPPRGRSPAAAHRRRPRRRRWLSAAVVGTLVLAGVAVAGGYGYLRLRAGQVASVHLPGLAAAPPAGRPMNLLVVGSDTRQDLAGQDHGRFGFPAPVRDDDDGHDNSGLLVTNPGCRLLDGDQALALARSRYYQYRGADGRWHADPGYDLGRIRRQQVLLPAQPATRQTVARFLGRSDPTAHHPAPSAPARPAALRPWDPRPC